jgi:hypothetical protein
VSEFLGFLGGLFFTISAIPLTYQAYVTRKVDTPWATIGLVFSGALCMFIYGVHIKAIPVVLDMAVCMGCWGSLGGIKLVSQNR